ncbi:uncharacterized protein CCOS01_12059 [Colletotrichum costaricense]|uniref:Uncharacterized protein n=1 Tax=Colletotrichum costaricense TaxID=1209916 RepID=A0AAI9YP88_9PEZI|nr:uncharacterized protein CCOS01_12059 [Colletotrichum costaricense]KAK1517802.1 hypothetical protein CCOS01_12059 [Colletotrichum costaricense]
MNTIAQSGVVHPEEKDLFLAAYWFRHERAFEAASLRLIDEISESFSFMADGKLGEDELVALRIAVLRNMDIDILSRGTPNMFIISMTRLADEKMSKNLERNRVRQCHVSGPPLGYHRTLMKCSVGQLKRSGTLNGLCMACLHPQMVCEEVMAHGEANDRGRNFRDWLPDELDLCQWLAWQILLAYLDELQQNGQEVSYSI